MKTFFYITTPIILIITFLVWAIPPYEVREERRASKFMTNEEIVSETKMCEDDGLEARANYKYFGGIKGVKYIICFPKKEQEIKEGDIKKSNITEVNVNIPK